MFSKNIDYKKLLSSFLDFKRACGYKYRAEEAALKAFYIYTIKHDNSKLGLTRQFMEDWATVGLRESRKSLSNRVCLLREFALYLNQRGYKVHILKSIKNANSKSFTPYVFSKKEIEKIFDVVDNLPISPTNSFNSNEIYPILFRFLYGCGLRVSEALNLKIKEVDTVSGRIEINIAKNDKKRIVMMSESLREICHQFKTQYLSLKNEDTTLFGHKDGSIRSIHQINNFFRNILWQCDIPYLGRGKGPYLHNLRHTFACHSFHKMSTEGLDMNVALPILSTYLGHESVKATERYLKLTVSIFPELTTKIADISSSVYTKVEYEK